MISNKTSAAIPPISHQFVSGSNVTSSSFKRRASAAAIVKGSS
nr:hypothetical protein [Enterococcus casseliflavus]